MMPATAAKQWIRGVPFEVKALDESARTFRGLAAAYSLDLGDDVIEPGAFKRTLDHWRASKQKRPIYLLNGHNAWDVQDVVGKMLDAAETSEGLDTQWEFVGAGDPAADAAYTRVKGGFITGLSIGYTPVQWEMERRDSGIVRHLKEVKLHEVSLVVFPMNEDARIDAASVKSLLDGTLTDEAKAMLRDLPENQKDALRALLAPAPPSDPPAPAHEGLVTRINALKARQLATRIAALRGSAPGDLTITEVTTDGEQDRGAA
jgi:HK97 family phage prohead protease